MTQYDEEKRRASIKKRLGAKAGTTDEYIDFVLKVDEGLQEKRNNALSAEGSNYLNDNQLNSQIDPNVLNKADEVVQRPTPFATGPNPSTTVYLDDDIETEFKINPFLNTTTEQQTYKHYLGGSGTDLALTDEMFNRAAKYAQQKLDPSLGDGSHPISFYENKEFNGTLGRATVHVKDGKVLGLEDYYDFDRKPWFGKNSRKTLLSEIGTRAGYDQNGAPFRLYGGMFKKRY